MGSNSINVHSKAASILFVKGQTKQELYETNKQKKKEEKKQKRADLVPTHHFPAILTVSLAVHRSSLHAKCPEPPAATYTRHSRLADHNGQLHGFGPPREGDIALDLEPEALVVTRIGGRT